jgi:Coenzyme PQQ synthesis protein D (PqqD)
MDRLFVINAPSVVSEIIDGEVIVMNLKSGHYYSSDKVGAVLWSWIEDGKTEAEMHRLAAARYGAAAGEIQSALAAFFTRILDEELVRAVAAEDAAVASTANGHAGDEAFIAPELNAYTDMQDLLFLDPIHDVDAVGWPKAKEAERG